MKSRYVFAWSYRKKLNVVGCTTLDGILAMVCAMPNSAKFKAYTWNEAKKKGLTKYVESICIE